MLIDFSVAEWLALLRCQCLCRDSVRVCGSNPWLKCRGQPRVIRHGYLESGRMGNISPATEPLRRYSTWPQIWLIARLEVGLQTSHPARSWRFRGGGGLTTGSFSYFRFQVHSCCWRYRQQRFEIRGSKPRLNAVETCKIAKIAWNMAGWVTLCLPWSSWIVLPSLTLTKCASGGSAWKHPSLSTCTSPNIPSGQKNITLHLTHFLDRRTCWRQ